MGSGVVYLHEGMGINQAGKLTHDSHMLASIPLCCTELAEVLHKVLQSWPTLINNTADRRESHA